MSGAEAQNLVDRQMELSIVEATEDSDMVTGELTEADVDALRRLESLYEGATKVGIKKLSKNDRAWAWPVSENHQAGFYLPMQFRGTLFPADSEMARRVDKPHILQTKIRSRWPGQDRSEWPLNYRRFTNKGNEGHVTVPPKTAFATLGPASFVVLARKQDQEGIFFDCMTVDSGSVVYSLVEERFALLPTFEAGVFDAPRPEVMPAGIEDELESLIVEFVNAAHDGTFPALIDRYRRIPDGARITSIAQEQWLAADPHRNFNPYNRDRPGDDLRELTADVEFTIYRSHELRFRAAQALEIIFRDGIAPTTEQIVQRVVRHFIPLYKVMLDASQQRKTRVGAGFESHIKRMLVDGSIPHEEQKVVSTRRPDFVMPNGALYAASSPDALVLAAKTTLRERWKQVAMEKRNCAVYLATMDEKVTRSAVREMADLDIILVVPESFKSRETVVEYSREPNVRTFREFFDEEIAVLRKPRWIDLGVWGRPPSSPEA